MCFQALVTGRLALLTLLLYVPTALTAYCTDGEFNSFRPDGVACFGSTLKLVDFGRDSLCSIPAGTTTNCRKYSDSNYKVYELPPTATRPCDCWNQRLTGTWRNVAETTTSGTCVLCYATKTTGYIAADPVVQGFDGNQWYITGVHGHPYALLADPEHQVNTILGSYAHGKHVDDWLVALSLRYRTLLVEVVLEVPDNMLIQINKPGEDGQNITYMGIANGQLPVSVKVNGEDQKGNLRGNVSIATQQEGTTLYFPAEDADSAAQGLPDGPLLVLATPTYEFTVYYETEASLHLDLGTRVVTGDLDPYTAHGVLGQTLQWLVDDLVDAVPHTHTMEGDMDDYRLTDGLTGTKFNFGKFSWTSGRAAGSSVDPRAVASRRRLQGHANSLPAVGQSMTVQLSSEDQQQEHSLGELLRGRSAGIGQAAAAL